MFIEEKKLQHWIDHFYGYGSWDAKIWFIGYEEGGGEVPEEVAEKLNYFYRIQPPNTPTTLCDIRELYQQVTFRIEGPRADLFSNLHEYRFGRDAKLHGFWKDLMAFAHGYNDKKLPDLLSYQKKSFVLPSARREAMITLYPLPSSHNHAWYYSWLDLPEQWSFLKSRPKYEAHVFPQRIHRILDNLTKYKPEVVVMYGMTNINALKESVHTRFKEAKFKMEKAIKQQIPQHHRADLDGTTVVITTQSPGLRHNRLESGFDWQEFGKIVR
jgi:hypothetical protein